MYAGVVHEEVRRGEVGLWDWHISAIEAATCPCAGCGGHLVDARCLSCGCGHEVDVSRFHGRMPAWYPVVVTGRCRAADDFRREVAAEQAAAEARRQRSRAD